MRSVTVAVCCLGIVAGCRPAADPEGQLREVRAARDQLYKAFSAYDSAALFGSYAEGGGWVGAWGLRPLEGRLGPREAPARQRRQHRGHLPR